MLVGAPELEPQGGVIADARRRRRRRRTALAAVTLAILLPIALVHTPGGPPPPAVLSSSLARLMGPPLSAGTHLRLVVSDGGPVHIVDVDRTTAQTVPGLALADRTTEWSPMSFVSPAPGGALAIVARQDCAHCARSQTEFVIGAGGAARRIASRRVPRHVELLPAAGSTAMWKLTWPHRGPCTLALLGGGAGAVRVPCGDLEQSGPAGVVLRNGNVAMLVDPHSGRVRARAYDLALAGPSAVLAIARPKAPFHRQAVALIDLAAGTRRALRWPVRRPGFGIQAIVLEPHGPLVAIGYGNPFFPPAQAEDIWILDTRDGSLTHLPGFPVIEDIKFSSVSWSADGRLVVASRAGRRAVIGVWRPGAPTLPIRPLPALDGYLQVVALRG